MHTIMKYALETLWTAMSNEKFKDNNFIKSFTSKYTASKIIEKSWLSMSILKTYRVVWPLGEV